MVALWRKEAINRFLVMTFNFVWKIMERNHGFIYIEVFKVSIFLSEISSDFCKYHLTHAKKKKKKKKKKSGFIGQER